MALHCYGFATCLIAKWFNSIITNKQRNLTLWLAMPVTFKIYVDQSSELR